MKRFLCFLTLFIASLSPLSAQSAWVADNGDGTFTNPLLWGDWPDPDVIRVGDTFYMVSTSMHYVPGVPVISSKDLVNWKMESYAVSRYDDDPRYDMQGGTLYLNGAWASSLRHHNGKFYVAFCTPYGWGTEKGHFSLCEADSPQGPWQRTVFEDYLYDPGLFFDDDGKAYVVHGQGRLLITPLSPNLRTTAGPAVEIWNQTFGSDRKLGTGGYGMEGSHMYKVNGTYYILCPAGGTSGWQVCLRSKHIFGPYEHKIVLDDDRSFPGNGLHQGGMVELENGEWWAVIMQDRGAFGRVPCLLPVTWEDGWPVMGAGGKDAVTYVKPAVKTKVKRLSAIATDDDFNRPALGLQWQWNHNPTDSAWSLSENPGRMRLHALPASDIFHARNTLTQRLQGPLSVATVELFTDGMKEGDVAGFGIFEKPAAGLAVSLQNGEFRLLCRQAGATTDSLNLPNRVTHLWLRAHASALDDTASFSYSIDGQRFTPLGDIFKMELGLPWTANRFALFCFHLGTAGASGHADFDNFKLRVK